LTLSNIDGVLDMEEAPEDEHLSLSISVDPERDVRPEIFRAACDRGWMLYEMSRQRQSLEHIFRELTSGGKHERNQ
jgi:ABC-2 type transport system ATP-binding protein